VKVAKAATPTSLARRWMLKTIDPESLAAVFARDRLKTDRYSSLCMHRQAFTMIELIVVIVLIALISTVGISALSGHIDQSRLVRATQTIADADRKERDAARQSPVPGGLSIDEANHRLRFLCSNQQIDLSDRFELSAVLVFPMPSNPIISYSQAGQSVSYAMQVRSKRGTSRWVLIVGMTGQVIFSDDENEVRLWMTMGQA
jgi:prepilin-type N-terminal cleavage/methylation domain-containing protein